MNRQAWPISGLSSEFGRTHPLLAFFLNALASDFHGALYGLFKASLDTLTFGFHPTRHDIRAPADGAQAMALASRKFPVLFILKLLCFSDTTQPTNFGTIDVMPVLRSRYTGTFTALSGMPLTDIGSGKRFGASSTVSTADGEIGVRILITSDRSTGGANPWKVTINRIVAVDLTSQ